MGRKGGGGCSPSIHPPGLFDGTSGGYGRACVLEEGWATISRVGSSYGLPAVVDDAQQAVLGEVAEVVHEAFEELPVVLQRPSIEVRVSVACSPPRVRNAGAYPGQGVGELVNGPGQGCPSVSNWDADNVHIALVLEEG